MIASLVVLAVAQYGEYGGGHGGEGGYGGGDGGHYGGHQEEHVSIPANWYFLLAVSVRKTLNTKATFSNI